MQNKKTTITFHLKQEDKSRIENLAESIGLRMADFCRVAVLEYVKQKEGVKIQNG